MGIFDFLKKKDETKKIKKRTYAGARGGRLFSDFIQSSFSADSQLRYNLEVLRNRSRELVRDNEFARRYVNLMKTNIVGDKGFHLQVKATNDDGSLDAPGNTIIENAFKSWGRLGNPTVDGRLSWLDCQKYAIETLVRDGEVFIKKLSGRRYKDNFAIQLIEPDMIDEKKNELLSNGNQIRMGVELDKFHKPVAYHVLTTHPGDKHYSRQVAQKHIRVPAEEMIHVFMPSRTYQTRGEPFMASVISSLKMLGAYREAEIIAARISASKMGMLTTPNSDDYMGDDLHENFQPIIDVEPGSFHQLPAGYDIKMFDPDRPNTSFGEFEGAILKGIASGLNVSYAALSSDLSSVNYSSIRQGALDERDHYKALQQFLIQHFVEPIFQNWLMSSMDFGSIPLPSSKYDKFNDNVVFRGRGWNWIDPLKEINASVVGLQNGILSHQDVQAHYGRDVEETFSQIAKDKQIATQNGLSMAFEPFGQKFPVEAEITQGDDNGEV